MNRPSTPLAVPLLAGAALGLAPAAAAAATPDSTPWATQVHSATFTGAGGDLSYGNGDTSVTTLVNGVLPLFDTALGTLERVDITLQGWRSISFTCTNGPGSGGCNARAAGSWILDGVNYPVWSFLTMATLDLQAPAATGLAPPANTAQSAVSYVEGSTSVSFTDPLQLQRQFTNATGSAPQVDLRLRFAAGDGGAIGFGGTAAITALLWDGDAALGLTYHYAPTPVPEPAGWATLAAGLAALGWLRRRRGPTATSFR